ncbi:phage head morphogenesis protein [Brumimicrobium mesophilum]|uniref:phage head morphogenesis protein n=1 Tax=Brumimicrobium mesophilum TaxID=392717 RepID=UPI00131D8262|nr:phage minor head protein [Brumimicrobium mesophilum]
MKVNLNADETPINSPLKEVEEAYKKLLAAGAYVSADIMKYKGLINATYKVFKTALKKGIADNVIPKAMLTSLENDVFVFSALKTHSQLSEASRLLLDEDGKLKSFQKFSEDVKSIQEKYNQNYLEAEYEFARSSAQMSAKWAEVESNKGRYNIQYRTAKDDKVRLEHEALDEITLPADDKFWEKYYPPNGWRCRCTAFEVRKSKYEVSDSKISNKLGADATSQIGKDGKNRLEIFRFNPGKDKVAFPPHHPYYKVAGAKAVKATAEKEIKK